MTEPEPIHYTGLAELAAVSPPSRELDIAVAVEVFGLPLPELTLGKLGWISDQSFHELPHYSTDRTAWLDVLEEMLGELDRFDRRREMKISFHLKKKLWSVSFHGFNPFPCYMVPAGQREGISIPHAICLAALNYAQCAKAKNEWRGKRVPDSKNRIAQNDVNWD